MASGGVGGVPHIAGELFKMMAGVDMLHVPYRGNPRPDLLAGQMQVMFDTVLASIEFIRTGKLRALAVTTATRLEALPDVPTPRSGRGGRRFKSCHSDQQINGLGFSVRTIGTDSAQISHLCGSFLKLRRVLTVDALEHLQAHAEMAGGFPRINVGLHEPRRAGVT